MTTHSTPETHSIWLDIVSMSYPNRETVTNEITEYLQCNERTRGMEFEIIGYDAKIDYFKSNNDIYTSYANPQSNHYEVRVAVVIYT